MKKISLLMILSLVLSIFLPAGALPPNPSGGGGDFDGYIVKLSDVSGPRLLMNELAELESVYPGENLYKTDDIKLIENLAETGLLKYAEPNYKVSLFSVPNDPLYDRQWNIRDIGIESAWDAGLTGEGVRIAVIDSGINAAHEDFAGVIISGGENFTDSSADVTDGIGHGTSVSGIIAAAANNGKGIAGMTDKATIIPLKCFKTTSDTSADYIIKAIYRAIDYYNANIINLSLGLTNNLKSFRDAIDYAESRNVVVLSSVGNNAGTDLIYPAAYDSVIGVGSVDRQLRHSKFSQINDSVFVVAPGEEIVSLGKEAAGSYALVGGTSYSTPHVTALAAMALGYNRKLTPAQIRDIIAVSCDDLGAAGFDPYFGYGIVNIKKFTAELMTYGTGNAAPEALPAAHHAQAAYAAQSPFEIDVAGWFTDEEGDELTYDIYSSTAVGAASITGSLFSFAPAAQDADKAVRFVIEARDREKTSEINAVLTVSVISDGPTEETLAQFTDMDGHWSRKYAAFAVDAGLMNGMGEARFAPDLTLSRAMFVTLLGRLSGEKLEGYTHEFNDVPDGWFSSSIAWASSRGVVTGIEPGKFGPDANVSRQQIAVFLYRYALVYDLAGASPRSGVYYGYADTGDIAVWAADAMLWAVSNGIISGKTDTALDPGGSATRAEAAAILLRFVNTTS